MRIGVSPSFGSKWLIPRLYRFLKQYPQVNVELATLGGKTTSNMMCVLMIVLLLGRTYRLNG
ncbi:hypothetical protein DLM_3582 [Aquitalea magnusonii]|uniref:LysR substrate-binding domain-containing protein n=1 Tax=Aquitalea magnusonii TaxID=332411 RepID=A0A3G9GH16_9NEIS|nr:hypothetical protein DLM_3582 [Aquitalea magnusonii]